MISQRHLVAALVCCFAVSFCPSPASAQNDNAVKEKKVTLNVDNAPVKQVLKMLFKSSDSNYTVEPDVDGAVSVHLKDVSFEKALAMVLRSSSPRLLYSIDGGAFHIKLKDKPASYVDDSRVVDNSPDSDGYKYWTIPVNYCSIEAILPFIKETAPDVAVVGVL